MVALDAIVGGHAPDALADVFASADDSYLRHTVIMEAGRTRELRLR